MVVLTEIDYPEEYEEISKALILCETAEG